MVKQSVSDRRSFIRAKRVLSIQFRIVESKRKNVDKQWYLSTTYDMSVGGIAFYTDLELCSGDILEADIVMSGVLDIYKGLGKVVRVEKKKTAAHYLVALKLLPKKEKSREAKSYLNIRLTKKISQKNRL